MKKFLVHVETETFIQYMYNNVLHAESSAREIKSRNGKRRFPEGAFAYQFYNQDYIIMPDGKKVPYGYEYDYSGLHYRSKGSKVYTLEQVKKLFPKEKTMIQNMEWGNHKKVIHTHIGNWRELYKEDKVV